MMHAHTTLASPSVPGLPSSCLQLHPSASLWRFVHLAVQEAVQEALVVQKVQGPAAAVLGQGLNSDPNSLAVTYANPAPPISTNLPVS